MNSLGELCRREREKCVNILRHPEICGERME